MLSNKKWDILSNTKPQDLDELKNILFKNRKINLEKDRDKFLNPPDYKKLTYKDVDIDQKQIKKTIKRLITAKEKKEKIIVFGDYDVDGVSATAIMWETLHKSGFNVMPFIPNRFRDGYGISDFTIQTLIEQDPNIKIIITVDNGIVAHSAAAEAKKKKIDLIITDHHQSDDKKIDCYSLLHSTKVSGSAVSYFVAKEIAKEFKINIDNHIELAALGTVADQMPLIGINRTIVWHGLKMMKNTNRHGLKTLIDTTNIENEIGTYDINFKIAPRINAAGRIDDATDALRLICSNKKSAVSEYAAILEKHNTKRQKIVEEVLQSATQSLTKREDMVVVWGEDLHEGVIGLAASKLVEVFYRPAIVISLKGAVGKASARSINGFNIIEAIREFDDLILQGGGHEMAAGFSIEKSNIEEFKEKIVAYASSKLTPEMTEPSVKIDSLIDFNLLNWDMIDLLKKFEPHGIGNPSVSFATESCNLKNIKTVGAEDKHLKFTASKDQKEFDAIAFGKGPLATELIDSESASLAYRADVNEWRGKKSIQLIIKDIK